MDILKVFSKEVETDNGGKFITYYGYRQEMVNGEFHDVGTPATNENGEAIVIAKPIKVKFGKEMYENVKEMSFPLLFKLDRDMKDSKGNSAFFITVDKDANKNDRLDKNGKRHLVCVIVKAVEVTPAPRNDLTLDDLDDFQ